GVTASAIDVTPDPIPTEAEGLSWGFKLVGTDLCTDDHRGGGYRYRLGEWHEADPGGRPFSGSDEDCPQFPGDGLCVARTAAGACSGGQSIGRSVMLRVGYHPADVLADFPAKLRVRRLWVHPDPADPVTELCVAGADLAGADLAGAYLTGANLAGADLTRANLTRANLT